MLHILVTPLAVGQKKKNHVELRIILEGGFCQGDLNVKNVCEAKNKQLTRIPELCVRMYI